MGRYANQTNVSVDKSKAEIEHILSRYGASQFIQGWDQNKAIIGFQHNGRLVKFNLIMPQKSQFKETPTGRLRSNLEAINKTWEQACRQSWRALVLVIKAKLEAVECGITTFEDEFLAYTCLPNGQTVSQYIQPEIDKAIESKKMPQLMPFVEDKKIK